MLEITAFEKASKSITSSAAETKNICLVEHESRILAQRPSFLQTIVWGFFLNFNWDVIFQPLNSTEHNLSDYPKWEFCLKESFMLPYSHGILEVPKTSEDNIS